MRTSILIIIILATSIMVPTSFAQESINCHFGDESTPLDKIFEKDLAAKEFLKKHPNSTRLVTSVDTNPPSGDLRFTAKNNSETETLTIGFYQNENGCYRPSDYNYSYDDGIIDVSITNSLSDFTGIINMIKSNEKKIDDFYPRNCNPINLNYVVKGDSKPHFCKIDDSDSIVMSLQKHAGGPMEIQIPYSVMDALFYNCPKSSGYFVLVNGEEVDFEWIDNNDKGWYRITVDLSPGYNKVEIIRTYQMNLIQEGFCGSIWSEHEKYLSPSLQKRIGVEPEMIKCNDNLILVSKSEDSPACVTPETKEKLEQRGWAFHQETLRVLDDGQQDIGRYLKQVSILAENRIDATISYPTNTAHHEMYPDEYQSIVSDCTEKDNNSSLSLLYLKEIDKVHNKITFTQEQKSFDGMQCDDALWQELTQWGYCGPPDLMLAHIDIVSLADAQKQVGFVFDVPKYLPEGYEIQKVTVGRNNDRAILYISPEPITDETYTCDFAWSHEGIYLSYVAHPEILNFGSRYSDSPGEPQTWPVTINGNPGKAEQRWVGDRFGTPIPQRSDLQVSMPDRDILVSMSSSLPVEELIKVAESISGPIFNSDIIPDYSPVSLQTKNDNEEGSIPVKITGKTSKQICNKIKMTCGDAHFFSATYDLHTNTATLEQKVSYNNYVLKISNRELCYKINNDPTDYCSFLNVDYSSILDGNKDTMLSQSLGFWKDLPREKQFSFHEEYGDLFFEELGKMVLKEEIKKELERQNIVNANKDFRLHTGLVEESLPPYVYYTTVINSTDGKSHMFGGRTHTNQVLDVYHEELVFYDDVSAKLPIDSFRNDSPVVAIQPENESGANTDKLFVNFDKNQDVTFVNSLSVPIRIQDKGSGNPEKEHELAWIGPTMKPKETWIFHIGSTGHYEWNAKLAPTEPGGWWEPHESGDIIVYSEDMSDVDFHEKLRIAGEFIMDSEIPVSSIGMGNNEGLRIGFSQAIFEVLPDARTYYMERAKQAIPFDVPIISRN